MIFKKKEFFLFIFLILLQSCTGGGIGNFLESSFSNLERPSQDEDLKKNFKNTKNVLKENEEINDKKYEKIKKVEEKKNLLENTKNVIKENEEINDKKYEKIKKVEEKKNLLENKKDQNLEKLKKQKNNKINNSFKDRNVELQSYKIIFILKDVDPKDPTKDLSTILRDSEVNFEIEKIERFLDSKNKSMNKN